MEAHWTCLGWLLPSSSSSDVECKKTNRISSGTEVREIIFSISLISCLHLLDQIVVTGPV